MRAAEDFDFAWVLSFLRPRAIAGLESVGDGTYTRALHMGDDVHVLRLRASGRDIIAQMEPAVPAAHARRLVRSVLDVQTDLAGFRAHVAGDDLLAALVARRPFIRLIRFPDPFEGLLRAILGQQVSLAAAATTAARIARAFGTRVDTQHPSITHALPTPQQLANTGESALRATGLTGAKARALLAAARAVAEGMDLHALARLPREQADAALRALPGVGPWTAAYVRMRGLGDRDAFPASDLGVLKALRRLMNQPALDAADATRIAEPWRPWRAYATLQLWHSLADPI